MTIKQAQQTLREWGITLKKTGGEYRVNYRDGQEATACYTDDLEDAIGTGKDMARYLIKQRFEAVDAKVTKLFHRGIEEPFQVLCSAHNNATDTANEGRFAYESPEFWQCAWGSLECLIDYHHNSHVRRWFKLNGV
jgi:hypothetical protein